MICEKCQSPIEKDARNCDICGAVQEAVVLAEANKEAGTTQQSSSGKYVTGVGCVGAIVTFIGTQLTVSAVNDTWKSLEVQVEGILIAGVFGLIAIVGLIVWSRQENRKNK